MLQGSRQSLICSFVFEELPKIYKLVWANKPRSIEGSQKTPLKPVVTCDQCKYKASMIQMKMHIKTVHAQNRPKRTAKRLQHFTPLVKPAKRSKSKQSLINLNSEGIVDDNSVLLMDGSFCGNLPHLEELVAPDISVEFVQNKEHCSQSVQEDVPVQIKPLFSCDKCEFDCEYEENLSGHMKESHIDKECIDCEVTVQKNIL